jgi:hypothetical protein
MPLSKNEQTAFSTPHVTVHFSEVQAAWWKPSVTIHKLPFLKRGFSVREDLLLPGTHLPKSGLQEFLAFTNIRFNDIFLEQEKN